MHRDVAPDNILMLYDRSGGNDLEQAPRPVLLDFGAARRPPPAAWWPMRRRT